MTDTDPEKPFTPRPAEQIPKYDPQTRYAASGEIAQAHHKASAERMQKKEQMRRLDYRTTQMLATEENPDVRKAVIDLRKKAKLMPLNTKPEAVEQLEYLDTQNSAQSAREQLKVKARTGIALAESTASSIEKGGLNDQDVDEIMKIMKKLGIDPQLMGITRKGEVSKSDLPSKPAAPAPEESATV